METPEQQKQDLLESERKIRRTLQRKLQQREDELDALKGAHQITLEEYQQTMQKLYDEQESNEKLIADMAKEFAQMDFDQMDELNQHVNDAILNGRLTEADSLLRTKGDIKSRVAQIKKEQQAELQRKTELNQAQEALIEAKAGTQKKLEDITNDCSSFIKRFMIEKQLDSAAYYNKIRADIDSTNLLVQLYAGEFFRTYLIDTTNAKKCFFRVIQSTNSHNDTSYLQLLGNAYNNLGLLHSEQNLYSKGIEYFTLSINLKESVLGTYHTSTANTLQNMGTTYSEMGNSSRALECYQQAISIYDSISDNDDKDAARCYSSMGELYRKLGKFDEAMLFLNKAISIQESMSDYENLALSYNNLGAVYDDQGNGNQSISFYSKALNTWKAIYGEKHPKVALCYNNIGVASQNMKAYQSSIDYLKAALSIWKYNYGETHNKVALCYTNLSGAYIGLHDYDKAMECINKALSIYSSGIEADKSYLATCYNNLGVVYYCTENFEKALDPYLQSLEIKKTIFGEIHPGLATNYYNLGNVYFKLNKYNQALEYYEKAQKLSVENSYISARIKKDLDALRKIIGKTNP